LAEDALAKAESGDKTAIETVGTLLGVEMLDPTFASEVQAIAQEINAGKLVDNSSMTQNNYDQAKGWQTKVEGGTAYIGEIHIQQGSANANQQEG
jgi:predicted lipoprotein with Yx(FWY)xxD motif